MDCGPDVWGRSVPQFEGRQLVAWTLSAVHCSHITYHVDLIPPSFAFRALEVRTWKVGIDERAVHRFGTGVWEPGFRRTRSWQPPGSVGARGLSSLWLG